MITHYIILQFFEEIEGGGGGPGDPADVVIYRTYCIRRGRR